MRPVVFRWRHRNTFAHDYFPFGLNPKTAIGLERQQPGLIKARPNGLGAMQTKKIQALN